MGDLVWCEERLKCSILSDFHTFLARLESRQNGHFKVKTLTKLGISWKNLGGLNRGSNFLETSNFIPNSSMNLPQILEIM